MQGTTSDRGYYNLLNHLSRPSTTLPLQTLQASISHYTAHVQPTPTPFVALVISSPLFQPPTQIQYSALQSLSTAFRHAIHIKLRLLRGKPGGLFSRGFRARVDEWVGAVLRGLQGGRAVVRLACACGCLLGLQDWETELREGEGNENGRVRRKVEEEVVVALAELLEVYSYWSETSHWESEFKHATPEDDSLTTTLLIVSPCLPLISPHRLKALQLQTLCSATLTTILTAFRSGTFLSNLPSSLSQTPNGTLSINVNSQFAETVHEIASSPIMSAMAPLARTCALSLSILAESRPREGWQVMSETVTNLSTLTRTVESDWVKSPLANVVEEEGLAPESRELATTLWTILKTLLFTNIMITQSILTTLVYTPQPTSVSTSTDSTSSTQEPASPYAFALLALQIFSHLSFVLPQFGGVASSTAQGGFSELKKVFYTALDILSASKEESERFVRELSSAEVLGKSLELPIHVYHAKKAYSLACVEQLVPVLSDKCIRTSVYPMCSPHLSDPSHRETYESAHSVMLAIFASHARKVTEAEEPFAEQITPFYAQCLLENSEDGRLSTVQLCLAYSALVRSAGAFGRHRHGEGGSGTGTGDAFAWFCIQTLLNHIHSIPSRQEQQPNSDHLHRLRLALIATVPSVSLTLLPRLLEAIRTIVQGASDSHSRRKEELVQALWREILESVGDEEKEYAMRWWYENRHALSGDGPANPAEIKQPRAGFPADSQGRQPVTGSDLVARL